MQCRVLLSPEKPGRFSEWLNSWQRPRGLREKRKRKGLASLGLTRADLVEGYMVTWKLKSCPRCKGDIFIYRETDGWQENCLLCDYLRDLSSAASVHQNGVDVGQEQPVQAE